MRGSSQLDQRQRDRREKTAEQPETHDDLRLGPTAQMEVMMHRRAAEDSLALRQLEVADLKNHADRLEDEGYVNYEKTEATA